MTLKEIEDHYRIIDQTLSGHAYLRDRYKRSALGADLLLFASSIGLCAMVFIDADSLAKIGISPLEARWIIGLCSLTNFFISIVVLRVDWKERSEKYRQSCVTLGGLKAACRTLIKQETATPEECDKLGGECAAGLSCVPEIPEKLFPKLKAHHLRKVALSKLVDANPGAPVWILRARLLATSTTQVVRAKSSKSNE